MTHILIPEELLPQVGALIEQLTAQARTQAERTALASIDEKLDLLVTMVARSHRAEMRAIVELLEEAKNSPPDLVPRLQSAVDRLKAMSGSIPVSPS